MDNNTQFYSRKELVKSVTYFIAFIVLCMVTNGIAFALLLPITFFCVLTNKNESLLYLLFIATTAMIVGTFFIPRSLPMVISQKVLMLSAAMFLIVHIFGRLNVYLVPLLSLLPYILFMVAVSQVGWAPIVSNLKLFLFTMTFFALLGASAKLMSTRYDIRKLRTKILTVSIFIIFGSIFVIPFPGISEMNAELVLLNPDIISLYQGVTYHSQALGVVAAMLGTLLFADFIFSIQRKDWLYYALILGCPILIYKTASRTGLASYFAGMAFVGYFAMRSRMVARSWRLRLTTIVWSLVIGISISILVLPFMREKVAKFITKNYSGDTTLVSENIMGSRQAKIDFAIENWKHSPIIGNGFQVTEDMKYKQMDSIKDILSAPVEKSTWIVAILEEGGIFGMILFCIFIIVTLSTFIRQKAYIGAALLFEFLVVNLGEFGIFAMSAEGGMFWCMVCIGLVFDYNRKYVCSQMAMRNTAIHF